MEVENEGNEGNEKAIPVDPNIEPGFRIPDKINFNPLTQQHEPEKKEEKAVETPVVEKPAEEVKPKEEPVVTTPVAEEKKVETPVTEKPVEEKPVEDKDKFFEVSSVKEFNDKLDEVSMEKYGASYQAALNFKNTEFEKLDDLDVLDTYYRMTENGITDVEIEAKNLKFKPLFLSDEDREKGIEDGKFTEDDLIQLDADFESLKRKALGHINKFKETISFDEIKFSHKQEETKNQTTVTQEQLQAAKDAVTKYMSENKQDKFLVKDKDGNTLAEVNVEAPEVDKVIGVAADPNSIYKLWMNEQGQFDFGKYTRDIARLLNLDKIVEVAHSVGYNKGLTADRVDAANITLNKEHKTPQTGEKVVTPHNMVLQSLNVTV